MCIYVYNYIQHNGDVSPGSYVQLGSYTAQYYITYLQTIIIISKHTQTHQHTHRTEVHEAWFLSFPLRNEYLCDFQIVHNTAAPQMPQQTALNAQHPRPNSYCSFPLLSSLLSA
jgi:hypothetical protein